MSAVSDPQLMNSPARFFDTQIRTAADIWEEISTLHYPADHWLHSFFLRHRRRYGSRDRRFFSAVVFSILRHRLFIDAWSNRFPFRVMKQAPVLLGGFLVGMIPEEVFAAGLKGGAFGKPFHDTLIAFAAGELPPGLHPADELEELSVRCSMPLWLVQRWAGQYGVTRCRMLVETFLTRPPLAIRNNPVRLSRQELLEELRRQRVDCEASDLSPFGVLLPERLNMRSFELYKKGAIEIQDAASQLVAVLMDPQPGEVIWDVCAGGGGKSLLLAALMKNQGRVVATDVRKAKLQDLKKRASRAGIHNIFPADMERLGETREMRRGADRVLVDAPCSGSGTLARNPDAKWRLTPDTFRHQTEAQLDILSRAAGSVRPGGRLYYATCSVDREENEGVLISFLHAFQAFRPRNPGGTEDLPGVEKGDGFLRIWPRPGQNDGFFLASVEKLG